MCTSHWPPFLGFKFLILCIMRLFHSALPGSKPLCIMKLFHSAFSGSKPLMKSLANKALISSLGSISFNLPSSLGGLGVEPAIVPMQNHIKQ